jgi:hypothetical protein
MPQGKRARMDQTVRDWNANTSNYNMNGQVDSVSATPFDLNSGSFYAGNQYDQASGSVYGVDIPEQHLFGASSNDWAGDEMWYLPPGAAFYQNVNDQVTQTAEGVNVGGMDLLDYMTLDNIPGMDNGSAPFQ